MLIYLSLLGLLLLSSAQTELDAKDGMLDPGRITW